MREILFCGKRIDNGEWVEGHLLEQDYPCYKAYIVPYINIEQDNRHTDILEQMIYEVAPDTVGQYTGLTANGKKIFEGNVGRYRQTDGAKRNGAPILCVGMVVYNAETASYAVDSRDAAGCRYFDYFPIKDFEVIGNIHDNPELLEGGAEE